MATWQIVKEVDHEFVPVEVWDDGGSGTDDSSPGFSSAVQEYLSSKSDGHCYGANLIVDLSNE